MRIRNSGSGFFGFGSGGNRSDSFKQGRKPGQKIRGTIIEWISEDMAWVDIEGHRLLAQLKSKPSIGTQLIFLVVQLNPDIILKEIGYATQNETGILSHARDFEAARSLFESTFRASAHSLCHIPPHERKGQFLTQLIDHKRLLANYLDTILCMNYIGKTISENLSIQLFYIPWYVPLGKRHLGVLKRGKDSTKLIESIIEFDHERVGMVRLEFLSKQKKTAYRAKLQRPGKIKSLKDFLQEQLHQYSAKPCECLGISTLPKHSHGGILSEIMFRK